MNQRNREILEKSVEFLTDYIGDKKITLTGSIALDIYGLYPRECDEPAGDIDFILYVDSSEMETYINIFDKLHSEDCKEYKDKECSAQYKINVDDFHIDLFLTSDKLYSVEMIKLNDKVYIRKPIDIINKKKKYGRYKDDMDIKYITEIINEEL